LSDHGCRVEPLGGPITVRVTPGPAERTPGHAAAIDHAWAGLLKANPRYFNGPILAYESYDPATGIATAQREEYRAHAVKRSVDLGLSFFGITGVVCVRDATGLDRLLLTRRAETVHDFAGQWEFGPCGGIDPPDAPRDHLTPDALAAELAREAREELGIDLARASLRHLALVHDTPDIGSTDLVVLARLDTEPTPARNWEVTGVRWMTLPDLIAWCQRSPDEVIPTTRAVAAWMHARSHPA
jgi:8-oxo-dGTP pyrophosphatase MutT (NUDIX family)